MNNSFKDSTFGFVNASNFNTSNNNVSNCNKRQLPLFCKKLSVIVVFSLGLLLSACEPHTGETIVSTESASGLNSIEIDLDGPTNIVSISEEINALPLSCRNSVIIEAFEKQQSDVQIKGCGNVDKILADDNKGSRHQKFIVQLEGIQPKHTILIAHNIDLAPKIDSLSHGDNVVFYGQYEYNPQGGVVHWTHHDPAARHQHGWIDHQGQRYQ